MFVALTTPDGKTVYVNKNLITTIATDQDFHNYEDPDNYDEYYDNGVERTSVLISGDQVFVKETPDEVIEKLSGL